MSLVQIKLGKKEVRHKGVVLDATEFSQKLKKDQADKLYERALISYKQETNETY